MTPLDLTAIQPAKTADAERWHARTVAGSEKKYWNGEGRRRYWKFGQATRTQKKTCQLGALKLDMNSLVSCLPMDMSDYSSGGRNRTIFHLRMRQELLLCRRNKLTDIKS